MADTGEVIKATVSYSGPNASTGQNIFYWQLGGGSVDDDEILDKIEDWLVNAIAPKWGELAPDDAEMNDVLVDVVADNGVLIRTIGSAVIGIAGTQLAQISPAAVAGYILAKTVIPRVKGSKYWPFIAESVLVGGAFSGTAIADLLELLAFYLDDLVLTGPAVLDTGVLSKREGTFVSFIDSGLIANIPAYQRRRKPNVGI